MNAISLGPLTLATGPVVLLLTWLLAQWAGGRGLTPPQRATFERSMLLGLLLALLAARGGHVLQHLGEHLAAPGSIFDIRDGGWFAPAGVLTLILWGAWQASTARVPRAAVWRAVLVGLPLWLGVQAALHLSDLSARRTPLPTVDLVSLDGVQVSTPSAVVKGRPSVVMLWTSWCGICRAEMPRLIQAAIDHPDVRFVFVNQGEAPWQVRHHLTTLPAAPASFWLDPASALGPALGSPGVPTTVFVDAQGHRVDQHVGRLSEAALQIRLRRLQAR